MIGPGGLLLVVPTYLQFPPPPPPVSGGFLGVELQNKYITKTTKQPRIGKVENLWIVIPCVGIYFFFLIYKKCVKIFKILSFCHFPLRESNLKILLLLYYFQKCWLLSNFFKKILKKIVEGKYWIFKIYIICQNENLF
jgi:hypothetical protein